MELRKLRRWLISLIRDSRMERFVVKSVLCRLDGYPPWVLQELELVRVRAQRRKPPR